MLGLQKVGPRRSVRAWLVAALVCAPAMAWANAAIPFIGRLAVLAGIYAFLLIVALETLVVWRVVKAPLLRVLVSVLFANALTTFLGVPLTMIFGWLVLGLSMGPRVTDELVPWYNLAALVPFFLISWFVEAGVLAQALPKKLERKAFWACFEANLLSYFSLAVFFVLLGIQL